MNSDGVPAISTNNDLYVEPTGGGTPQKITGNPGADNSPLYSPDGRYLAYRAQSRPGYGIIRYRCLTKNQKDEVVQSFLAAAMLPARSSVQPPAP